MFTASVDSILKTFTKISNELEVLIEKEAEKVEKYKKDIGVVQALIAEGEQEIKRAQVVKNNINKLAGV